VENEKEAQPFGSKRLYTVVVEVVEPLTSIIIVHHLFGVIV
jgi:hypothetical protein